MIKILFVCHGNICRSPMAEYILKDMAVRAGVADRFEIDSAAVSRERSVTPSTRLHAGNWDGTAFSAAITPPGR